MAQQGLWRMDGTYVGFRDGDWLWSSSGEYLGKFRDDRVYGPDGRYLGELWSGDPLGARLVHNRSRSSLREEPTPKGNRAPTAREVRWSRSLPDGWDDFPR